ncbi:MAG: tRNA lysidine(34) synthetase TilS [Chloroflexi bacterium]|nr:tRNA lysidine(34) synthetase TilS [Chloroflexota bacterium]|tara:strand:- start:434 stop:1924 length:1491 start_codon:yes stop_codon:yes gene_type:complete
MNKNNVKINLNKRNRIIDQFLYELSLGLSECKFDIKNPLMISASGGPDSSALLLGLKMIYRNSNKLFVIHVNHQLRGNQSYKDQLFVNDLCDHLKIPLLIKNTPLKCKKLDLISNVEEKLSHSRYDLGAKSSKKNSIDTLVTGHTIDDNAETVLLNITRGSYLEGISGIKRIKKINSHENIPAIKIIRPMLGITKNEIKKFLKEMDLNYRTDSSNIDISFSRNRIRHIVIPELEQLNPKFKKSIFRLSENASSQLNSNLPLINNLWNSQFLSIYKGKILIDKVILNILSLDIKNQLFLRICKFISKKHSISSDHLGMIQKLLKSSKYIKFEINDNLIVENFDSKIVFKAKNMEEITPFPNIFDYQKLNVPGKAELSQHHIIQATIYKKSLKYLSGFQMETFLDLSKVQTPLFIRTKKTGDKIKLLGMSGHKSLNHLMIDKKIPTIWRKNIPIVVKNDRIVWIVGFPPADWAKVTQNTTKIVNLRYLINDTNESPVF